MTVLAVSAVMAVLVMTDISRVWPEDYYKEDHCNFPWGGELARS